jgi:hypothetical protein
MTTRHSANVTFEIQFNGELFPCEFFTIDDRFITVSVAGRKRTTKLGDHPPLAMAESVALGVLEDKAAAEAAAAHVHKTSWIDAIASRLHHESRSFVHLQGGA